MKSQRTCSGGPLIGEPTSASLPELSVFAVSSPTPPYRAPPSPQLHHAEGYSSTFCCWHFSPQLKDRESGLTWSFSIVVSVVKADYLGCDSEREMLWKGAEGVLAGRMNGWMYCWEGALCDRSHSGDKYIYTSLPLWYDYNSDVVKSSWIS